jgi:hypothetical protein
MGWDSARELPLVGRLLRGAVGPLQVRFLVSPEDRADLASKASYCNDGNWLGMFWVDYRECLPLGNLTKYGITGDKMIDQLLFPQFQRHCKLKGVQSA